MRNDGVDSYIQGASFVEMTQKTRKRGSYKREAGARNTSSLL